MPRGTLEIASTRVRGQTGRSTLNRISRCQWLQLFEDELDDDTYRAVPTHDSLLGYNPDHPWVREKLATAPEFRPAILVHLSAVPPMGRDTINYIERVVALC